MQHVTILLLTETWINNEKNIDVQNFHCTAKFQRHNNRAGGGAVYENKGDATTYVPSEMDVASNTTESFGFNDSCIGEMCAAKCKAENGQIILTIIIFNPSPSSSSTTYFCDRYFSTSKNLSTFAASSACPVLETTTTPSNTITSISQDAKETSKPRRKKRPPKNTSNAIKPKIEIKVDPHKPRKSAPTEYTTEEEDMLVYDVEDEPEPRIQNIS
ncbi:uncharacterized protein TNCV_887511 [Trichonephila clavipes]|uniref:Uncharacterized protein n=1 Tax=Trichonephila clavipes TaxID=2585209 RepID=A0A8X6R7W9_TRICX|nr:uncharacterized protein TNCV_887511 [Trichonephila clavipes]